MRKSERKGFLEMLLILNAYKNIAPIFPNRKYFKIILQSRIYLQSTQGSPQIANGDLKPKYVYLILNQGACDKNVCRFLLSNIPEEMSNAPLIQPAHRVYSLEQSS